MRRIGLAVVVTLSLFAAPLAAEAQQQAEKVHRVGYLGTSPPTDDPASARVWRAFLEGLRDHGYVEGQNIIIERRYSEGKQERFPGLAAELVRLKVDLIVAGAAAATRGAQQATTTIPIVAVGVSDPVGLGLVASLARPGGNITGLATLFPELAAKRLALLKETFPKVSRVAVLWNSGNPGNAIILKEVQVAARTLGVMQATDNSEIHGYSWR
jgi:ABC-type uncharacterized transport system substrate-binding protein